MVCSSCTLLHPLGVIVCSRCGTPLRTKIQRASSAVSQQLPTTIGVGSGISLLSCLIVAVLLPSIAAQALAAGAYFGIISITNIWLSVYKSEARGWFQGTRGICYCGALLVSLVGELSRMQGMNSLTITSPSGASFLVAVPSALSMELIAALLIVLDPLIVNPLIAWIQDGVERTSPGE